MAEEQAVTTITPEEEDADFASGFSGSEEPATETPAATVEEKPEVKPEPEGSTEEVPAKPAEPETVQITKDQFERLTKAADTVEALAKQQDRVNGTLGAFKQTLERLQQETPAGQAVEVSEADFEDLANEFGPELVGGTIKGLNKVLGRLRGTGGQNVDPKQFETVMQERISQAVGTQRAEMIDEVIGDRHPDWKELRDSKPADYQEWLNSLPEADRTAYLGSSNPFQVAKRLDDFKVFRAKRAEPPPPSRPNARKEIIQAAVAPRGTGGNSPAKNEDDDFSAGFKKYAPPE